MARFDAPTPITAVDDAADPLIDPLAFWWRWTGPAITYSFPEATARWYQDQPSFDHFEPLGPAQRDAFRAAMAAWGAVMAAPLVEVQDGLEVGTLRPMFGYYDGTDSYSRAYFPNEMASGGDMAFGTGMHMPWAPGSPEYVVVLHEIGHALGLTHPFDTGHKLPFPHDDRRETVMSYTGYYTYFPTTPMVLDVLAIQYMYGPNLAFHAGDDVYTFDDAKPYHETIWDGGGIDTLRYSGVRPAMISLEDGVASTLGQTVIGDGVAVPNVWIAIDTLIENAESGSGNDHVFGNADANRLAGGPGEDSIQGARGDDTLVGGAGADEFGFALWDNEIDLVEDMTAEDRLLLFGAQFAGAPTFGDGTGVGRFEMQCRIAGGETWLYFGTNTSPGADVVVRLAGSWGADRFALDGQFIRVLAVQGQTVSGTSGNDTLTGTAGNDTVSGGAGLDTLACTAASAAYAVTREAGSVMLTGPDGADALSGIERLRFADGMAIALDAEGHAGQAYRLYRAAFDRVPDLPGFGYQMNDLDTGWALTWVAGNFIASPEFQATYGAVGDADFIRLLYRNVLDREAEAAGLAFHLAEFAQGESRAAMLTHFSESPENQANVIGQIGNGMLYVPLG